MAPAPTTTTARLFVDYVTRTAGFEHTFQVRYGSGDPTASVEQGYVASFLTAIGSNTFKYGWKVLRVRTAQQGQTFTMAQPIVPALGAFSGTSTGAYNGIDETGEWTYQARSSTTGRRLDISLYGILPTYIPTNTGRWAAGASGTPTWVNASVGVLQDETCPFLVIDGSRPVWYSYVNYNHNSYWERRLRLG